ncbi:hypothetical protein FN846DRAFT_929094 [Sphaerosporella brunnea]|uniref:Uncharacterized protein n=1 Tax=Sphaerosporella brunnea TaxID=1250544 RepID=A0A5J5F928_9PEZI|nr:hypothetical protein FN846DRAFT_929094 [Sphaerosporella brunnea]
MEERPPSPPGDQEGEQATKNTAPLNPEAPVKSAPAPPKKSTAAPTPPQPSQNRPTTETQIELLVASAGGGRDGSTQMEPEAPAVFDWNIQNDTASLDATAKQYNTALTNRRSRIASKVKQLEPEWDENPDDSDDSIDWQVALRLPIGVRPRKRLRRDPGYTGPLSPRQAPPIYPYSSSDDDSDGDVDPSGEARRRRRARMAENLETSGEMERVAIRDAVIKQ